MLCVWILTLIDPAVLIDPRFLATFGLGALSIVAYRCRAAKLERDGSDPYESTIAEEDQALRLRRSRWWGTLLEIFATVDVDDEFVER